MKSITLAAVRHPEKPNPISANVCAATDTLVVGDVTTITAAVGQAGLSREHLSRELSKPHVAVHNPT
jgi:hypothetical protein